MMLFMEGLYLHNLMFLNLFRENRVKIYCYLGWGLPMIFIIPWVILKRINENVFCWTQHNDNSHIGLLIHGPIAFTVVVSILIKM